MHWNIYTTGAQNLLLHVSVLLGCHHQGVRGWVGRKRVSVVCGVSLVEGNVVL
jgi:hypothetical protein